MACVAALSSSVAAAGSATGAVASSAPRSSVGASASLSLRRSHVHGNKVVVNFRRSVSKRSKPLSIRATAEGDSSAQIQEFIDDLKAKWDQTENKSTVVIYAGGALVALWFSSTIVGAINSVPLLPKVMELIGLGYTGWFVYRYLLFKSSRKELVEDIEELKGKITGAANDVASSK
ncbi:protein CURVATURE THYLAKOID 1A, chloroplastic [Physcomitrium patens]|uniref:Cyanobacterial aminoacyl-tRNA synthetase CAAD domain-containing protein n=1 Tax=Physcomitrium patens TaxID=3218 RepID=A0A2K1IK59_PHYPA|nr:protein CURVATURE THYLAKOID 1A, chloroplastic-like [Physcomitrium patens]PNR29665.1 hypothetical protein PHYPA_028359 [Physcomitrium patens]|eukprot:XP_024363065.1 protein CURVATURE THYLAKOID 1A, chloroplastic-like [Physcomitrella patens]